MMTATKETFSKIDPKKMYSDLPFLPERMKMEKCRKVVCNIFGKKELC